MLAGLLSDPSFWTYAAVGFAAQIVDGALGMAYGTLCTAVLLATGMPPVTVSASVHSAQFFTTGLSALSHSYFKNVDRKLLLLLAVFGICGGIGGALLLTQIDGKMIKPWISAYLMVLGVLMLWKLLRPKKGPLLQSPRKRFRAALGALGGFLDALGGGGWGPIVTTSLLHEGENPRMTIGSVNAAEFFVKTVIAMTFITTVGIHFHEVVLGLLAGGVVAAPFGAYVLRLVKPQILIALVALLIIGLSVLSLYQFLQL
jgi:uncharacterized membrane protein YfcA